MWAHISIVIRVFFVSSCGYARVLRDSRVDAVNAPEGIHINQKIGEGFIRAGLECIGIASSVGIKGMNRCQNRIRINARATSSSVGSHIAAGRIPVALEV
jgi:hypothetical protein